MIDIFDRKGFDRLARIEADTLQGADLRGLDLSNANLVHLDLRDADLSGCKLVGADLRLANLSGANLSGADLSDSELMGCQLAQTKADGITLSGTKPSSEQRQALKAGGADLKQLPLDISIKQE